jgi:Yip1 domain
VIKVFYLIFEPSVAWDKIAQARRGFAFILTLHLLPLILIASFVEGWGLLRWGKWQPNFQRFRDFDLHSVITFEAIQAFLLVAMILVSALLLLRISQTFENRRTYLEAFTVMAYGFSPLLLAHLLNVGPTVSPWTSWLIGLGLTFWILYQGIPRVMQTDPTHAFGLYLSALIIVVLTSGIPRVMTALYLLGQMDFQHSWFAHKFPILVQ